MIAAGRCSSCNDRITVISGVKVYHGMCDPHARMQRLEAVLTKVLDYEDFVMGSASHEGYRPHDHVAVIEEARALLKEARVDQRRRG